MITARFLDENIKYTGEQLQGSWIYHVLGIEGDTMVSFIGECDVLREYMVDTEDLANGETIYSEQMLHFIAEYFEVEMEKTILKQRLLAVVVEETLNNMLGTHQVSREGDDLFDKESKLTVSIATTSPMSSLIHFGINISSKNTPVKTKGLADYRIDPKKFADEVLKRYKKEEESVHFASKKVKLVSLYELEQV